MRKREREEEKELWSTLRALSFSRGARIRQRKRERDSFSCRTRLCEKREASPTDAVWADALGLTKRSQTKGQTTSLTYFRCTLRETSQRFRVVDAAAICTSSNLSSFDGHSRFMTPRRTLTRSEPDTSSIVVRTHSTGEGGPLAGRPFVSALTALDTAPATPSPSSFAMDESPDARNIAFALSRSVAASCLSAMTWRGATLSARFVFRRSLFFGGGGGAVQALGRGESTAAFTITPV